LSSRSALDHIRMISEGPCDTEDWRNYAENYILKQYTNKKQLF